jgi:hypothetical protein
MKSLTVFLLFPAIAAAVCLNGYPTVQKEYALSKLVFTGRVVQDQKTSGSSGYFDLDGDTYTVVPTHVYKGESKAEAGLFSENSSGRFPMQVGQEYLIFAYEDHGRLIVDNCGNSNLISHSRSAVAAVAKLSRKGK